MNGIALNRRLLALALLSWMAAVAVALVVPVRLPESGGEKDAVSTLPAGATAAAPEDLEPFLNNRRWGVSLKDLREAAARKEQEAAPDPHALNPVLAKMGFVGLIVTDGRSAVLLKSPDGVIARVEPGARLPDGRTLVSVTDNSLTLEAADGPAEVLTLFPPVRTEPGAGSAGDDPGAGDGGTNPAARDTGAAAPAAGVAADERGRAVIHELKGGSKFAGAGAGRRPDGNGDRDGFAVTRSLQASSLPGGGKVHDKLARGDAPEDSASR